MKNIDAKTEAPVQKTDGKQRKLKIKTSAQTESLQPQLPCQLMLW